ncbi:unnamed protein product [Thelazia callipaeda]|uniref:AMMECR1 domain-containing protein n=1 Tax=Thelazia callipaeda TaxID=103827 RepID=A0A3P7MUI7_THECL|nr:unnamed protein product [Thelazia callipaeda]
MYIHLCACESKKNRIDKQQILFVFFLALTRNSQRRAAKANLRKHYREHYHIMRRLHQHQISCSSIVTAINATATTTTTATTVTTVTTTTPTAAVTSNTTLTATYQLDKKIGHISGRIASLHMTAYCFDVLYAALRNHQTPRIPPAIPNEKYPLFVTWKKGYDRRLRGCIGTFTNLVLHKGLHEYAIIRIAVHEVNDTKSYESRSVVDLQCLREIMRYTSSYGNAFKDSRFDPITLHEVDQLHCTVSILINFEKARDYRDWVVGIHGIRIEFQDNHHYRDAVYLPEVASEQGWDHTETINNLMRKGGFRGHISEETRMKVNVVRFQSDKVLMSHQEYVAYKANYGEALLTDPGGRRGLFHSCRP